MTTHNTLFAPHKTDLKTHTIFYDESKRSSENHLVWAKLFDHVKHIVYMKQDNIFEPFISGFEKLDLNATTLPTSCYLNNKLKCTGWQIAFVEGFISTYSYAAMISNKQYPINYNIRDHNNIFYSSEPDFMHDVLGHIPMLFLEEYRSLLQLWAKNTLKYKPQFADKLLYDLTIEIIMESNKLEKDKKRIGGLQEKLRFLRMEMNINPTRIYSLGNFFDWFFEFGIIKSQEKYKIFGAAIITSSAEVNNVCNNTHLMKNAGTFLFKKNINYAMQQKEYFFVNEFSQYIIYLENLVEKHA